MATFWYHRSNSALLLGLFFALPLQAETPVPDTPVAGLGTHVEALLDWAEQHNPELAAMRFEAEAASERVAPAGALPDPMLRMELQDVTNKGLDASPNLLPGRIGGAKYTLSQSLPFWGKRDLQRDLAAAEASGAQSQQRATHAELRDLIKTAYAQHYQAQHEIRLTQEILQLARQLEQVTQSRYANGLAPQQDLIKAQIEQTALRNELIALQTEAHHAQIKLNAALARPATAPLAMPRALRPLSAAAAAKLDAAWLEERAREANPFLLARASQTTAASNAEALTHKNRYPDFTLGISPVQQGNRVSEWELMLELNIPLQQGSRRAQERAAAHQTAAARSRLQAASNFVLADLHESLSALQAARAQARLIEQGLLPQTELNYHAALAGYQTGKVDFATLQDAGREIRKAKINLLRTHVSAEIRRAQIERIIGEEL